MGQLGLRLREDNLGVVMNLFKILVLLFPIVVYAGSTRTIDADGIRSADASKTYTLPSASTTLIGTDTSDTVSNKSISGSSNTFTNIPANTALTSQVPISNGGTNSSSYNSGGVLFFNGTSLVDDYANLFWDSTNKRLGIGTAAPGSAFHYVGLSGMRLERVDSSATSTGLGFRKARGSVGSESSILNNDMIGAVSFTGYGATTYGSSTALLSSSAQENFTDSAKGTRAVISTTPNGSTTMVSSLAIQDSTVVVGRGFSSATPSSWILRGTDVVGGTTDTASGHVIIRPGLSTGSAASGNITFQLSPAGTSGSSQNAAVSRFAIYPEGLIKHYSPDGTKYLDLVVSNSSTNHSYTWPTSQGASDSFLKNDGSGNLSWSTFAPTYEQETPSGSIDGSNVSFTLSYTPTANSAVQVYLDGIFQEQGSGKDYTVSGTTITFATAPSLGQALIAIYTR